jgi:hypothetical protein
MDRVGGQRSCRSLHARLQTRAACRSTSSRSHFSHRLGIPPAQRSSRSARRSPVPKKLLVVQRRRSKAEVRRFANSRAWRGVRSTGSAVRARSTLSGALANRPPRKPLRSSRGWILRATGRRRSRYPSPRDGPRPLITRKRICPEAAPRERPAASAPSRVTPTRVPCHYPILHDACRRTASAPMAPSAP